MSKLDPREVVQADQLRAEIAGSQWRSAKQFVRALNDTGIDPRVEYTGFTKRLKGKSPIPASLLLACLDLLGVDYLTFVQNALARLEQDQNHG